MAGSPELEQIEQCIGEKNHLEKQFTPTDPVVSHFFQAVDIAIIQSYIQEEPRDVFFSRLHTAVADIHIQHQQGVSADHDRYINLTLKYLDLMIDPNTYTEDIRRFYKNVTAPHSSPQPETASSVAPNSLLTSSFPDSFPHRNLLMNLETQLPHPSSYASTYISGVARVLADCIYYHPSKNTPALLTSLVYRKMLAYTLTAYEENNPPITDTELAFIHIFHQGIRSALRKSLLTPQELFSLIGILAPDTDSSSLLLPTTKYA